MVFIVINRYIGCFRKKRPPPKQAGPEFICVSAETLAKNLMLLRTLKDLKFCDLTIKQ